MRADAIRALVMQGDLPGALREMVASAHGDLASERNRAILLSARLARLAVNEQDGTISTSDAKAELNQIAAALLKLLERFEDFAGGVAPPILSAQAPPSGAAVLPTRFDVALSFAGEDRALAEALATGLREAGIVVYYDLFFSAAHWGRDLTVDLNEIYGERSQYCVILVSRAYVEKAWTTHERRAAFARALRDPTTEYILPIQVDGATLPGLTGIIAYAKATDGIDSLCQRLVAKVRRS